MFCRTPFANNAHIVIVNAMTFHRGAAGTFAPADAVTVERWAAARGLDVAPVATSCLAADGSGNYLSWNGVKWVQPGDDRPDWRRHRIGIVRLGRFLWWWMPPAVV
jgi:hypothetical protein